MKRIIELLLIIAIIFFVVSCGFRNGNKTSESYLSRNVSCYSTPGSGSFGIAVRLDRENKKYTLYENSFRNQEWRLMKEGKYYEKIEDNIAICDLHIEPESFGDIYEVKIYLNTDKAAFVSLSSELDASLCDIISKEETDSSQTIAINDIDCDESSMDDNFITNVKKIYKDLNADRVGIVTARFAEYSQEGPDYDILLQGNDFVPADVNIIKIGDNMFKVEGKVILKVVDDGGKWKIDNVIELNGHGNEYYDYSKSASSYNPFN